MPAGQVREGEHWPGVSRLFVKALGDEPPEAFTYGSVGVSL